MYKMELECSLAKITINMEKFDAYNDFMDLVYKSIEYINKISQYCDKNKLYFNIDDCYFNKYSVKLNKIAMDLYSQDHNYHDDCYGLLILYRKYHNIISYEEYNDDKIYGKHPMICNFYDRILYFHKLYEESYIRKRITHLIRDQSS